MNSWPKLRWKIACFRNKTTQKISSLRTAIVYKNFIFTQEYAFAERCCFLIFSFEGKFRKYDISVKRKHTKNNENIIFSVLFTNFCQTKILIFMQWFETTSILEDENGREFINSAVAELSSLRDDLKILKWFKTKLDAAKVNDV